MSTSAERTRAYRERKRADGDPIRAFLLGVASDASAAIDSGTVEPWRLARADQALALLAEYEAETVTHKTRLVDFGQHDHAICLAEHEADFRTWLAEPGNLPVRAGKATTPALAQARRGLAWAEAERVAGRANSPVIAQGLRAAKLLIRERHKPEVEAAYADFTQQVNVYRQIGMGNGMPDPRPSHRGDPLPEWAIKNRGR